jgi:hypothetical protein
MHSTLGFSAERNVFEGFNKELGHGESSELRAVSWADMKEFLTECRSLRGVQADLEREAKAARLIAWAAVENVKWYRITITTKCLLAIAALNGIASVLAAELSCPYLIFAIGAASALGALPVFDDEKRRKSECLEQKWRGLLPRTSATGLI